MPKKDFFVDIDLNLNSLKKAVLEKNVNGTVTGQISYDTFLKRIKIFDGATNRKVLQDDDIINENDMSSNSPDHVPTQSSVKSYVDLLRNDLASTLNGLGASLVGIEDSGGYFVGGDVEVALQEIGQKLQTLSTGLKLKGDIDASTNTNYPAGEPGDTYFITASGKIGGVNGELVNTGDMLVCKNTNSGGDHATVGSDWFVVESNRDQATETTKGVIRIALTSEVDAGTDDTTAVTPLKLKQRITSIGLQGKFGSNLTGQLSTPIISVDVTNKIFTIQGDVTQHLTQGMVISVSGSTSNDGNYVIQAVTLNGTNTDVTVYEDIPSSTADGNMISGYKNVVNITGVDVSNYPVINVYDNNGVVISPYISVDTSNNSATVWFSTPYSGTPKMVVVSNVVQ